MSQEVDNADLDPRFRAGLARLWPEARGRHVNAIGLVLAHLAEGPTDGGTTASEAAHAAHQIAGSIGIFGLPELAGQLIWIERYLDGDVDRRNALAVVADL